MKFYVENNTEWLSSGVFTKWQLWRRHFKRRFQQSYFEGFLDDISYQWFRWLFDDCLMMTQFAVLSWYRITVRDASYTWWRHQMETFSALKAICNSPVTGEFPAQRPVTWSFDVLFGLGLNKRLSKQSWGSWFETPSHPLWRHCNDYSLLSCQLVSKFCCVLFRTNSRNDLTSEN